MRFLRNLRPKHSFVHLIIFCLFPLHLCYHALSAFMANAGSSQNAASIVPNEANPSTDRLLPSMTSQYPAYPSTTSLPSSTSSRSSESEERRWSSVDQRTYRALCVSSS